MMSISWFWSRSSNLLRLIRQSTPLSHCPTSISRLIPDLRLFSSSVPNGLLKSDLLASVKDFTIPSTEKRKVKPVKKLKVVDNTQKKKVYSRKKQPPQYMKHVEEFEKLKASSQDRWKEIPGFPAYEVSSSGVVFSKIRGKFIALQTSIYGYHSVYLSHEGKQRRVNVHYLVASLFLTRPPELKSPEPSHFSSSSEKSGFLPHSFDNPFQPSFLIQHLDGNRENNHFLNLSILTDPEKILSVRRMAREEFYTELTGLQYKRKEKKWQIKLDGTIRGYYEDYKEAKKQWRRCLKKIFKKRLIEENEKRKTEKRQRQTEKEKKTVKSPLKTLKKANLVDALSISSSLSPLQSAVTGQSQEFWKEIEGFPGYLISSLGRVYSQKQCKILKDYHDKDGHVMIVLPDVQAKRYTLFVHRLVAKAFLPLPTSSASSTSASSASSSSIYRIHHLDGDSMNNAVTNLTWMTRESSASLKKRRERELSRRVIANFISKSSTSSGYCGIYFQNQKWQVRITISQKNYLLGHFKRLKDAIRIRKRILQDLSGEKIDIHDSDELEEKKSEERKKERNLEGISAKHD
jgi:hypothetical protein